jgi:hypothetical protein
LNVLNHCIWSVLTLRMGRDVYFADDWEYSRAV